MTAATHPELTPVVVCHNGQWAATAKHADHAEELRWMFDDQPASTARHCAPHRIEWWTGSQVRRAQRKARGA